MEFSFNTLTVFPLVKRRRSWAPWARVEGSAKRGNGPSSVGFNSQAGIDRGSCRALMLMTGTAMKCGANRTLKEWARQARVRPQRPGGRRRSGFRPRLRKYGRYGDIQEL